MLLDDLLSMLSIANKSNHGYLFGDFSIADGFYTPICLRLKNYHIATNSILADYIDTVRILKALKIELVMH